MREGRLNADLQAIIRANVRLPEQVLGDIAAQIAAGETAARGLRDLVRREAIDDLAPISREIRARTERDMRDGHRRDAGRRLSRRARSRRHRRGRGASRSHDRDPRRRDVPRLCRHVARGRARPQHGDELYRSLFLLPIEMRARSGNAAQRGHLPHDPRQGARGLDPQSALPRTRACPPARRPLPRGRHLQSALADPGRAHHRRIRKRADLARHRLRLSRG